MATNSITIKQFLTNSVREQLVIPIYQRPYSWQKEQIEQFWSDVINTIESTSDNSHFMGLFVLTKEDSKQKSFDIIDGQQRVTTICLILALIRDLLDDLQDNHPSEINKSRKRKIDTIIGNINECLINSDKELKLKTKNEKTYESDFLNNILLYVGDLDTDDPRYVQHSKQKTGYKNTFEIKLSYMTNKQKFDQRKAKSYRSLQNYMALANKIQNEDIIKVKCQVLEDKIDFYCDSLAKTILDKFEIIDFETSSHSEAFNIFEALNDRGLAVTSTDLIKNICLKKANTQQQSEIFDLWKQIFDQELTGLDHIQFLRYSNNSRRDFITKTEIYNSYNKLISEIPSSKIKSFLESEMLIDAIWFKVLKDDNSSIKNKSINNSIKLLQSTKSNQWYSIALSSLRGYDQYSNITVSQNIIKLFEIIHEIVFCIILGERKANLIEKKFPDLAKGMNKHKNQTDFIKGINSIIKELEIFKKAQGLYYRAINIDAIDFASNNNFANMILFFIEYKKGGNHNLTLKTVEHILPQNPNEKNWPVIKGMSDKELEIQVYSLGNMILIEKPLNSRVKAISFKDKLIEYKNFKIIDLIEKNNKFNLSKIKKFDTNVINERKLAINKMFSNFIKK